MTKRPGAAALAGGALLALLYPGTSVAQDAGAYAREISGGYASWTTADGLTLDVTEPAVQGTGNRARFPAIGGGADPETGDAEIELGGAAQLGGAVEPLTLGGLRLELADDSGSLYVRTVTGGRARELALAYVSSRGAAPAVANVRKGGVTWTGLRASLTDDGARLLSEWSGREFTRGGDLGLLDVTVGTGTTPEDKPEAQPEATPEPTPTPSATAPPEKPSATTAHPTLTAGGEQTVTGTGFEPGEIVLVAIDEDTRYQTVADAEGRIAQAFPVYAAAAEGAHTVELHGVSGERNAVAQFDVRHAQLP